MSDNSALRLLSGEAQGFAIDATTEGGSIAIRDTTTKANNHIIHGVTNSIRNGLDSFNPVRAGSAKLVQSGTSPKMVLWDSAPYVRWTPHNLLLQSQTFDNGSWTSNTQVTANSTTAPDGTVTADTFDGDPGGGAQSILQGVTGLANTVYTLSIYAKYNDTQWFRFQADDGIISDRFRAWFDLQNGVLGTSATSGTGVYISHTMTDVGSGWYRLTLTGSMAATTFKFRFDPSTSDGDTANRDGLVDVWGAQLNRGPIATPYLVTTSAARIGIPQEYDTAASKFGILVEPAATNLALRSETLDNSHWSKASTSVSSNATTAPDGSTTADKVIEDTSGGTHEIYQVPSGASGNEIWSIYAKAAERTYVGLWGSGDPVAVFDLTNGTIATDPGLGVTATITAVGNGWYRCTYIDSSPANTGTFGIMVCDDSNGGAYTGDGTSGLYLWGAQCEEGTVATSYIPTLASTVTRAVDAVTVPTATFPWSSSADSFIVSLKPLGDPAANDYNVLTARKDDSDRLQIYHATAATWRVFSASTAGDGIGGITSGTAVAGTAGKVGLSFGADDAAISANGAAPSTDTTCDIPADVPTLYLGGTAGSSLAALSYRFYQVYVVPRAISDTELQAATT